MDAEITRYEVPVSMEMIEEIWAMWETVPEEVGVGEDISWVRDELSNAVRAEDRKLLYVARVDGKIAGTSVIWVSRRDPKLAEFALPGTAPEFRRRGIGQALFDAPIGDFTATGGEAIFLGASSYAFRTYMRAGYHKLVGTTTLAYVASGELPEAYLVDFFRGLGPAVVGPGEGADRTSAVPLVFTPHDWQVMDANLGLLSLRYNLFGGFSGRAGGFVDLLDKPDSTFFAARAGERGKVVGLSTAKLSEGVCSVDGFTHPYYENSWNELIESAAAWGAEHGAERSAAVVSEEDWRKREMFEALGFEAAGRGDDVLLDGMQMSTYANGKKVRSIRLQRPEAGQSSPR